MWTNLAKLIFHGQQLCCEILFSKFAAIGLSLTRERRRVPKGWISLDFYILKYLFNKKQNTWKVHRRRRKNSYDKNAVGAQSYTCVTCIRFLLGHVCAGPVTISLFIHKTIRLNRWQKFQDGNNDLLNLKKKKKFLTRPFRFCWFSFEVFLFFSIYP